MRAPDCKSSGEFEKPRDPQLRDNDHHAQQKRDGVEIDGFEGFFEAQSPERDQQACPNERDVGAIDPSSRPPAESDAGISRNEDHDRGKHPKVGRCRAHRVWTAVAIWSGFRWARSRVSGMPKKYKRNPEAAMPAKTRKATE